MSIKGGRPNNGQITPHLLVHDGEAAIDFYRRALGAEELYRSPMPGGAGVHVQLRIADSTVLISSEHLMRSPQLGAGSPKSLGGSSVILELYVGDVDAAYQRAIDAGATATLPISDAFFGDRYGQFRDPFGHIWALSTAREELTPEQVAERMNAHSG